jgi:hypothetical protein
MLSDNTWDRWADVHGLRRSPPGISSPSSVIAMGRSAINADAFGTVSSATSDWIAVLADLDACIRLEVCPAKSTLEAKTAKCTDETNTAAPELDRVEQELAEVTPP